MMDQQQQQQRVNSFFRANRPGNLNISDVVDVVDGSLLIQPPQLTVDINNNSSGNNSPYHQTTPVIINKQSNNSGNVYAAQQQHSPHYQAIKSSQQQMVASPSYIHPPASSQLSSSSSSTIVGSPVHHHPHHLSHHHHASISLSNQQQQQQVLYSPQPYMNSAQQQQSQQSQYGSGSMSNQNGLLSSTASAPAAAPAVVVVPTTTATTTTTTSYADQQQISYTPKYSPSCIASAATASSAHIVNKQAQYFNFDVNNVYSDNNMNKPSGGLTAASNLAHQSQQHVSMSSNPNVSSSSSVNASAPAHLISPRYVTGQPVPPPQPPQLQQTLLAPSMQIPQSPNQQQHGYMFNNYQTSQLPLSPAAFATGQHVVQQQLHHLNNNNSSSHSVPNSPLLIQQQQQQGGGGVKSNNTHSTTTVQPTHSVFQFSANHIQSMNANNNITNSNNRFCPPMSAPVLASNGSIIVMASGSRTNNTSGGPNTTSNQLYEFQSNDNGLMRSDSVPALLTSGISSEAGGVESAAANLVTSNTFTEHDVDMVDEVLNDMLQKEEEQNQTTGSTTTTTTTVVSPTTPSAPNLLTAVADETSLIGGGGNDGSTSSSSSSDDMDQPPQPVVSQEEKPSVTTTTTTTIIKPTNNSLRHNVASSYSLSNLSQAASVEFELNFANLNTNRHKKSHPTTTTSVVKNEEPIEEDDNDNDEEEDPEDDDDESLDENMMENNPPAATSQTNNNMYSENNGPFSGLLDMIKPPSVKSSSSNLIREAMKNSKKTKNKLMKHDLLSSYENNMEGCFLGSPSSSNHSLNNGQLANMMSSSSPGGANNAVPQICPICSKLFTNKSALAKHRLTHSNERKYTCHICDKAFKRQDHLNGHMLTHQDKKPFSCKAPGCDKSYCDSRSLKRHVESQHQDYLALLACGNQEALNYLPNIGKIKANIGPNIQQEILVTNEGSIPLNPSIDTTNTSLSTVTASAGEGGSNLVGDGQQQQQRASNTRPKNFFTFEEPKPEKCKICGKGFKNIPALNGHMRLHGGTLKDKTGGSTESKGGESSFLQNNEDSLMSNCSNNSGSYQQQQQPPIKQQSFSHVTSSSKESGEYGGSGKQLKAKSSRNAHSLDLAVAAASGGLKYFKKESSSSLSTSRDNYSNAAHSPANSNQDASTTSSKLSNLNMNSFNNGQITSNHHHVHHQQNMQQSMNDIISSIYPSHHTNSSHHQSIDYSKKSKQYQQSNGVVSEFGLEFKSSPQQQQQHDQQQGAYGYENRHPVQFKLPQAPPVSSHSTSSSHSHLNGISYHKPHHSLTSHDDDFNSSSYQSNLEQYVHQQQPSSSSMQHHNAVYDPAYDPYEAESDYNQHQLQHNHHQNQIARPKAKYGSNSSSLDNGSSNNNNTHHSSASTVYQNELNLLVPASSSNEIRRCSPQLSSHHHHHHMSEKSDHQDLASHQTAAAAAADTSTGDGGNNSSNNVDFKHIYDITLNAAKIIFPAVPLEQVSMQAVAATAVAVATVKNQQQQQQQQKQNNFGSSSPVASAAAAAVSPSTSGTSSANKSKLKPGPLFIPSDINAFQNRQNALDAAAAAAASSSSSSLRSHLNTQPPPFNHSSSYSGLSNTNPSSSHHHNPYANYYPNATLLKSPRLFPNYHDIMYNKKQYTPPPMLSPFRKGPGLFYNPKFMSLFLPMMAAAAANANNHDSSINHHHQQAAPAPLHPGLLNHSVSYSNSYQVSGYTDDNDEDFYDPDEEESSTQVVAKKPRIDHHHQEVEIVVDEEEEEAEAAAAATSASAVASSSSKAEQQKLLLSQISENGGGGGTSSGKPSLMRSRLMSQISTCSITSSGAAFFPADAENANETIAAAIADCAEINTTAFINVGDDYQAVLPELSSEKSTTTTNREDLMISPARLTRRYAFDSKQFNNYLELVCNSSLVYGSSNNLELGLHVLNYFEGDVERAVKGFLNVSIELPAEHPIRTYKYNETECWSGDEIRRFEAAIIKHDKVFSELAAEVGSKSVKQCVEFYYLWKKVMSEGVRKKWRHVKRTRMNNNSDTSDDYTATTDENNNKEEKAGAGSRAKRQQPSEENDLDEEVEEENGKRVVDNDSQQGSISKDLVAAEFNCHKCNKVFKTKRKLRTHLNSHITSADNNNNNNDD